MEYTEKDLHPGMFFKHKDLSKRWEILNDPRNNTHYFIDTGNVTTGHWKIDEILDNFNSGVWVKWNTVIGLNYDIY
jgi:hypothetical protein